MGTEPLMQLFLDRFAHGDELLGGGWVDPDGGVELGFGGAALQRHSESLDDLTGVGAHHVNPENLIGGAVDHELHHGVFVATREGVLHRSERSIGRRSLLGSGSAPLIR